MEWSIQRKEAWIESKLQWSLKWNDREKNSPPPPIECVAFLNNGGKLDGAMGTLRWLRTHRQLKVADNRPNRPLPWLIVKVVHTLTHTLRIVLIDSIGCSQVLRISRTVAKFHDLPPPPPLPHPHEVDCIAGSCLGKETGNTHGVNRVLWWCSND